LGINEIRKRTETGKYQLGFENGRASWWLIDTGRPPCSVACPAGVNAKAYTALIAEGRFDEALSVVRERLPLPGVMGRICSHPCEAECVRGHFDDPIAICSLKRFIADYELRRGGRIIKRLSPTRPEKVAIIGAGPAGLTAAHDLLLRGFHATVFDQFEEPGGMLLASIPSFRLPRDILALETGEILRAGVELEKGVRVGTDLGIEDLFERGYSAVLIAIGAHKGILLGVEGEELDGVLDAISFLASVNLHGSRSIGKRVVVIGGGDSAIDSARVALRLGADEVRIAYRRSRVEMPARDDEINEAIKEGITIDFLVAPTQIVGAQGKVNSIELRKMRLGEPDSSGRRRPVPIQGSEFTIKCDSVVAALGQRPDLGLLSGIERLETTRWDTIVANEHTCATSRVGIFAAGDVVSGPATAVDAIGAAHRAAEAITTFIDTGEANLLEREERHFPVRFEMVHAPSAEERRIKPPTVDPTESARSFDEAEAAYSVMQARNEASRCLMCGACSDCELCANECDGRYVALIADAQGEESSWGNADLLKIRRPELQDVLGERETQIKIVLEADDENPLPARMVTPIVAVTNEDLCIGCGACSEVCSYTATRIACRIDGRTVPILDSTLCRGCGSCVANCPTGAIDQMHFSNESLAKTVLNATGTIVLACIWGKVKYPKAYRALEEQLGSDATSVDLLCTGRLPAWLLLKALQMGADRVVVAGCGADDCRYGSGQDVQQTVSMLRALLEMLGMPPDRIRLVNFDADDPQK